MFDFKVLDSRNSGTWKRSFAKVEVAGSTIFTTSITDHVLVLLAGNIYLGPSSCSLVQIDEMCLCVGTEHVEKKEKVCYYYTV